MGRGYHPMHEPSTPLPELSTLFDFLPVGAYRSLPSGEQLRANPALVKINGYDSEAQMLAAVRDIALEWYVEPGRRAQFQSLLERDGQVRAFVSEIHRHRSRERIWISENAHTVRDAGGRVLYYEGTVEDITARVHEQQALAASEARLRSITAQVPGIVFQIHVALDGTLRYLFVSEGVRALCGVAPEDVLTDSARLLGLLAAGERARLDAERRIADDSGLPLMSEFQLRRPDGSTRWVQLHSAPMARDALGVVRSGVMLDITGRKAAEDALRDSDERWKLALEATGDGVWDIRLDTGVEVYSPRFKQMYGYDDADVEDRVEEFDQRTHPDDVQQMLRDRADHLEGRTPAYVNEHRVRCNDGRWKWTLTRGLVIERDAAGRPLRMIGTHTDIDERRQAEALRAERDRAAAADQAKTEMLSRISHELRTPLNAVLGFAQLLDTDPKTPVHQRPWVQQLLASGRHLLGLVEDVLDLSSAQSGQFSLDLVAVDLGRTLAQSWMMLAADAQRAQVSFVDGFASRPPLTVRADPRRLRQVLSNLLSNAIKYNRAGGRIVFDASRDGTHVQFRIADTGRGMDAEQLTRAFRPFERLGAQVSSIQGTGLGLALARQLVEAMNGTIAVDSRPGEGSTFTVSLLAADA